MMSKALIVLSLLLFNQIVGSKESSMQQAEAPPTEATLLGIDLNENQVRDDVERRIDELYSDPGIRIILKNGARIFGQMILASGTAGNRDNDRVSEASARFIWCLHNYSPSDSRRNLATLKALVINTEARREAYVRYEISRYGTTQELPRVNLDECTSDDLEK